MAAAGDPEGGVRVLSTQGWCWDLRPVGQVKGGRGWGAPCTGREVGKEAEEEGRRGR